MLFQQEKCKLLPSVLFAIKISYESKRIACKLIKMKALKIVTIGFLLIFILIAIWFNLPINVLYHSEIRAGNEFVVNVLKFKSQTGHLPKENDWVILEKLNPKKPYESFYPEYRILDQDNFSLTFIEGFDPPYLQYDTKGKKWEKK